MELREFGQYLIGLAMPILSQGYVDLVQELKQSRSSAIEQKQNRELVTAFEKEAERVMTEAVRKAYPHHAIVGEEHGYHPGSSTRWVFDPIDGTSAMIRTAVAEASGHSLPDAAFGITLAVVEGDEAIFGIVTQLEPKNGKLSATHSWIPMPLALPPPPALSQAKLACTVPEVMFTTKDTWSGWQALSDAVQTCITDRNCIGFMGLLTGDTDIAYEAGLAYHDAAALVSILESAGITVTDDKGQKLRFPESAIIEEFRVLAARPKLHAEALALIRNGVPPEENRFTSAAAVHKGYAQKFPKE